MPGARRLVDYVRNLPWHPAVVLVTGSGQGSLLDKLNDDFDGAFPLDMRVTARNVTYGKPHPHPYLKGMEIASASPCESIAIENAPLGVESARRSGAFTVAVTTGPIPAEAMEAAEHISYTDQWRSARRHFLILCGTDITVIQFFAIQNSCRSVINTCHIKKFYSPTT